MFSTTANLLNQIGLALGFLGGLMMAIDLLGAARAESAEAAAQKIVTQTLDGTKRMLRDIVVEPVKNALPTIGAVCAVALCALVFYLLSLSFSESNALHKIFYGLSLFMAVPLGIVIILFVFI